MLLRLLRARWGVLRLSIAALVLWALVGDHAGRLARLELAALPDMDYAGEVRRLSDEGRFGEAVMIADAGLLVSSGPAHEALAQARQRALDEQASWARRLKSVGMGAVTGRGESLEALAGAVTADLFIVGDVRDVIIEGSRLAIDGEADGVILALSSVGVATTIAPEIDWGVSLLKIGRKTGAVGKSMGEQIVRAFKRGDSGSIRKLAEHSATLARSTSPATALRALRGCESVEDAAQLATFVQRNAGSGALALHVIGPKTLDVVRGGERAEKLLIKAARKGDAGAAWLRSSGRVLARPHLLVGLAKGLYKGNVEALVARLAERLDPHGWWITPLAAAWVVLEMGLLWRRLAGPGAPVMIAPAPALA